MNGVIACVIAFAVVTYFAGFDKNEKVIQENKEQQ